jgi:hypothetical protein
MRSRGSTQSTVPSRSCPFGPGCRSRQRTTTSAMGPLPRSPRWRSTGTVTDRCYEHHGKAEFLDFLRRVAKAYPRRRLQIVLDNYPTHKHDDVNQWLAKNQRVTLHLTPISGSWLNLVEVFFSIITRQAIRRGAFDSVRDLIAAIRTFIDGYNGRCQPFLWTKTPDEILPRATRRWRRSDSRSSWSSPKRQLGFAGMMEEDRRSSSRRTGTPGRGRWRNAESGRGRSHRRAGVHQPDQLEPARRCKLAATVLHVRVLLKLQLWNTTTSGRTRTSLEPFTKHLGGSTSRAIRIVAREPPATRVVTSAEAARRLRCHGRCLDERRGYQSTTVMLHRRM